MRHVLRAHLSGAALATMLALLAACGGGGPSPTPTPAQTQAPAQGGQATQASDWCTPGSLWGAGVAAAAGGGVQEARIVGMVQFKGKPYCKAEFTADVEGQQASYAYYFNEDDSDVWVVVEAGGQTQELHLVGGQ